MQRIAAIGEFEVRVLERTVLLANRAQLGIEVVGVGDIGAASFRMAHVLVEGLMVHGAFGLFQALVLVELA